MKKMFKDMITKLKIISHTVKYPQNIENKKIKNEKLCRKNILFSKKKNKD